MKTFDPDRWSPEPGAALSARGITFGGVPRRGVGDLEEGVVAVIGLRGNAEWDGEGSLSTAESIRRASFDVIDEIRSAGRVVDIHTGRDLSWAGSDVWADLGDLEDEAGLVDALVEDVTTAGAVPVVLARPRDVSQLGIRGFVAAARHGDNRPGLICLSPDLDLLFGASVGAVLGTTGSPARVSVAGVRGFAGHERWREVLDIATTVIPAQAAEHDGVPATAARLLEVAGQTDPVFVFVDMAVVELGGAPGRSGGGVSGLHPSFLLDLCASLSESRVCGIAIGGLKPDVDVTDRSATLAAWVVVELVASTALAGATKAGIGRRDATP